MTRLIFFLSMFFCASVCLTDNSKAGCVLLVNKAKGSIKAYNDINGIELGEIDLGERFEKVWKFENSLIVATSEGKAYKIDSDTLKIVGTIEDQAISYMVSSRQLVKDGVLTNRNYDSICFLDFRNFKLTDLKILVTRSHIVYTHTGSRTFLVKARDSDEVERVTINTDADGKISTFSIKALYDHIFTYMNGYIVTNKDQSFHVYDAENGRLIFTKNDALIRVKGNLLITKRNLVFVTDKIMEVYKIKGENFDLVKSVNLPEDVSSPILRQAGDCLWILSPAHECYYSYDLASDNAEIKTAMITDSGWNFDDENGFLLLQNTGEMYNQPKNACLFDGHGAQYADFKGTLPGFICSGKMAASKDMFFFVFKGESDFEIRLHRWSIGNEIQEMNVVNLGSSYEDDGLSDSNGSLRVNDFMLIHMPEMESNLSSLAVNVIKKHPELYPPVMLAGCLNDDVLWKYFRHCPGLLENRVGLRRAYNFNRGQTLIDLTLQTINANLYAYSKEGFQEIKNKWSEPGVQCDQFKYRCPQIEYRLRQIEKQEKAEKEKAEKEKAAKEKAEKEENSSKSED